MRPLCWYLHSPCTLNERACALIALAIADDTCIFKLRAHGSQAARSLLANSDLNLGPYIHVLMPALLSCVLAKRMGGTPSEDHWSVRDAAARVIALACARLGPSHPNMQPRVTREYSKALTDDAKPLATRYGGEAAPSHAFHPAELF